MLNRWSQERRERWLQTGMVAATLANVFRGKGGRSFTPEDFMPGEKPTPRQQTPEEQIAIMRAMAGQA